MSNRVKLLTGLGRAVVALVMATLLAGVIEMEPANIASADDSAPTVEQLKALDRINYYRGLAGVPPARLDKALRQSAVSHAKYIQINGWNGDPHGEVLGKEGFSGASMSDRAKSFGYSGTVNEDMSTLGDPIKAVDGLMNTVSHRAPMKRKYLFYRLILAGLSLLALTACQDSSSQTATSAPGVTTRLNLEPTTTPPPTIPTGQANPTSLAPATTQASATSPAGGTVAAPTPVATGTGPGSAPARDQALKAVRKLAQDSQSFRYKLAQQGELKSGGSQTQFEAIGGGEWQRPAFHQLLTIKLEGQQREVEHFGRPNQLFQRVVELAVWRKQEPAVAGPFPGPDKVEQGGNFKEGGKETIAGRAATKLTWENLAAGFLAGTGQPEGMGALSATNLWAGFSGDKTGPAQAAIWLDEATGQIARYQLTLNLAAGDNTLRYTATYDYSDFDAAGVKVDVPGDLSK